MPSWTPEDRTWMERVLALAAEAYGETSPNPLVGAVVVGPDGIVGTGVHRRAGMPHAEPQALEAALTNLEPGKDAAATLTLYVNLEPCSHQGQTPPCVEAILRRPVARVVAAMVDPNPLVSGAGIARLRATGVAVEVGLLRREAEELNHVFIARQRRKRPFVALKVALSADGCIAGPGGETARITGTAAQEDTHRLRAGLDAVLVGVETLSRDRPRLDRRLYHGPGRSPRRIVLDPRLRSRPEWLWPGEERSLVFCAASSLAERREAHRALAGHADIVPLPTTPGGLDLQALTAALESHGIWSVLVEGGGHTHRTFLEADLWDRLYVLQNPNLRLEGLGWEAASLWESRRQGAVPHSRQLLGGETLDVFDHPQSSSAGGSEGESR